MDDQEIKKVGSIHELPPEVRDPIMRDAEHFAKEAADRGTTWLCESMALFKYQVEGAHVRLDELKLVVEQLVGNSNHTNELLRLMEKGEPEEDSDWWKGERN